MLCGSYQSFVEFVRLLYDFHMICVEHVWKLYRTCVDVVWNMCRCCVEVVSNMCGGCVDVVSNMCGTCVEHVSILCVKLLAKWEQDVNFNIVTPHFNYALIL